MCSDIHLSDKTPLFRTAETDWYSAMKRSLIELDRLAGSLQVPIACAGDIFDKWKASPRLINFAYNNLPNMISIPGQHDLPYHSYGLLEDSAYTTLIHMGVLQHMSNDRYNESAVNLHPFGWSAKIEEPELNTDIVNIAFLHKYVWQEGNTYPGADETGHVDAVAEKLPNMDLIVCGDNHSGFHTNTKNGCEIFNCGTFMRRTASDRYYSPQVGIVYENGSCLPYYLDTTNDQCLEPIEIEAAMSLNIDDLEKELKQLGDSSIDFVTEIRRYCQTKEMSEQTIEIIERVINE